VVQSGRLVLRELTADDGDALHRLYGDERVTEHLSFTPRDRGQAQAIMARSIDSAAQTPRSEYSLAVALRDDLRMVGFARLALDPHQQRAATVGFALQPDQWGRGLGRETVWLLGERAFNRLCLHRIWAARAPLNSASATVLTRAGFTEEGLIRAHVHVRDRWRDSVVYGLLSQEQPASP
jgi:ribosomal-protein-alanine N-acetyltransferase